jgi:hypothetical protein
MLPLEGKALNEQMMCILRVGNSNLIDSFHGTDKLTETPQKTSFSS